MVSNFEEINNPKEELGLSFLIKQTNTKTKQTTNQNQTTTKPAGFLD